MIKFFRKIRQQLLAENRFSKYLLYAVGEIVLVVIGILIALQLNNWNSERKAEIKELDLLAEMRQNLEADLNDCRYNIDFNKRINRGCAAVLEHWESKSPFHDSLRVHFANLMGFTVLTANTSAYDHLKSIGFDLVENDNLRRSITRLYSERYTYLDKVESSYYQYLQTTDIAPQIYEKLIVDSLWVTAYPIDTEALMEDQPFQGMIRMNIEITNMMIRIYSGIEKQIRELIDEIDTELNARTA